MRVLCHTNAQGGQSLPMKRFIDPQLPAPNLTPVVRRKKNPACLNANQWELEEASYR